MLFSTCENKDTKGERYDMGKYSFHIVEMVRNNGIPGSENAAKSRFFMFDYFDVLYYKELEGEEKHYLNYFKIDDAFENIKDHKVSHKSLSLYQMKEKIESTENPFTYGEEEKLSQAPFIGIVQISLCKENFKDKLLIEEGVEKFLCDCESKIENIVEEKISEGVKGVLCRQLYRSSTTGDFCLVLRADSMEEIYKIALALNDSQNSTRENINVLTYTSVGMECKRNAEGEYCTLSEEFISLHSEITFALRFSADSKFENALNRYNQTKNSETDQNRNSGTKVYLEITKGLFGRYDYLLNIGIEEFAEIYPVLCERKIEGKSEQMEQICESDNDITSLNDIIRYPYIRNINERVLVKLPDIDETDGKKNESNIIQKYVRERNRNLYDMLKKMEDYREEFSEEYRAFQDLMRGMYEIFKSFSSMGMEKDAYVSWLVFHHDMNILCECFNTEMGNSRKTSDESRRKEMRIKILKNWRINLEAINQYTRLVQNVNYQTYQSPVYEIQTQLDTEKAMVAYREAMEVYLSAYQKSDIDRKEKIFPIIYPDLSKDEVKMNTLFLIDKNGKRNSRRIAVCTVPSFEYFGRLYDLLPWIFHESSHQIRIFHREKRNYFVVEYVLEEVFKLVMQEIFQKMAAGVNYREIGIIERKFVRCMTQVALQEIFQDKSAYEYDFEQLVNVISKFLNSIFFYNNSYFINSSAKSDANIANDMSIFLLNEYQKQELLEEDNGILEKLEKIYKRDQGNKDILDKLVTKLLYQYNVKFTDLTDKKISYNFLFQIEDFQKPVIFIETKVMDLITKIDENNSSSIFRDALKEYYFSIKQVYRMYVLFTDNRQKMWDGDKAVSSFSKKTFKEWQNEFEKLKKPGNSRFDMLADPDVLYIMRNLGLLNNDCGTFCNSMIDLIKQVDGRLVQQYKRRKTTIYREACADLFMVTSLRMDSFGYFRQILQTISDTQVEINAKEIDNINFERFRFVTAVLLKEEGAASKILDDVIEMDGSSLVEKGKLYCHKTLKCIREKMLDNLTLSKVGNKEEAKNLICSFINKLYQSVVCNLETVDNCNYKETLLYILLHGKEGADAKTIDIWNKYDSIRFYIDKCKYQFLRIEVYIDGLNGILQNGYIYIAKKIFVHMLELRNVVKGNSEKGCCWEDTIPQYLIEPKLNVGKFYNDPEYVYTLNPEDKLENTIEFIQNYYYYNRFRVLEEEDGQA